MTQLMEIHLISRACEYCGRIMRVSATSPQRFHSKNCEWEFEKWGPRKNLQPIAKLQSVSVFVDVVPRTPSTWLPTWPGAESQICQPKKLKMSDDAPEKSISETKNDLTANEPSDSEQTGRVKMQSVERDIRNNVQSIVPLSEPSAIAETQPALLGDSQVLLEKAALDSMSLLNSSATRLMALVEESVSLTDLEKSKTGDKRVESHRIATAIDAANALANTIQTGVNMMKAIGPLLKGRDLK